MYNRSQRPLFIIPTFITRSKRTEIKQGEHLFSLVKFDNKLILFIFSKKKKAKLVLYDREIAFGIYELL